MQLQPNKTISSHQHKTQNKLRKIHCKAHNKRKQFLDNLLRAANAAKDTTRQHLIIGLKHVEDTRRCFHLVQQHLNPSTPGSLTSLLVPNPDTPDKWITIRDPLTMEQHLLECSQSHFKQAHGTPFTVPPLSDLLGFDGLTPFGDHIHQGLPMIPPEIPLDPATHLLLLSHQKTLLPPTEPTEHPLEFKHERVSKMARTHDDITFWQTLGHLQVVAQRSSSQQPSTRLPTMHLRHRYNALRLSSTPPGSTTYSHL